MRLVKRHEFLCDPFISIADRSENLFVQARIGGLTGYGFFDFENDGTGSDLLDKCCVALLL